MRFNLLEKIAEYLSMGHRRKIWKRFVTILAAIVVFITTYSLIIPAITLGIDSELANSEYMFPVFEEQDDVSNDMYDVENLQIDSNDNGEEPPPEEDLNEDEFPPDDNSGEVNDIIEDESQSESESETVEESVETETSTSYDSSENEESTESESQSEYESDTTEEPVEMETSTAFDSSVIE